MQAPKECLYLEFKLLFEPDPYLFTKRQNFRKIEAFADDKIDVAKIMISVYDRVEKIVGKGENAGNKHFLLFPQCFQKVFFLRVVKSRDSVV